MKPCKYLELFTPPLPGAKLTYSSKEQLIHWDDKGQSFQYCRICGLMAPNVGCFDGTMRCYRTYDTEEVLVNDLE